MQANQTRSLTVYVLRLSYRCFNGTEGSKILGVYSSVEKAREKMRANALSVKGKFFTDPQTECYEDPNNIRYDEFYSLSDTPDMYCAWEITEHEVE